ncbi:MAG: hypothetical protein ACP5Q1_10245, partial [Anaerolineae bacterium]
TLARGSAPGAGWQGFACFSSLYDIRTIFILIFIISELFLIVNRQNILTFPKIYAILLVMMTSESRGD